MSDSFTHDDFALLDRIAAETIEPVEPPAAVRERVMLAIRRNVQLDESVPGAHESVTLRAAEGRWMRIAEGVRCKKLSVDEARGTVTLLLELAPHAILPAHDHQGSEDSYVVRGSCQIGAVGLSEGDFHHVNRGAHHGDVVASAEGCTLLLTVDRSDYEAA